jgi:hypothetical protein
MGALVAFFSFRTLDWERRAGSIWFVLAIFAFAVGIPAGFWLNAWKCPRCQKTFRGGLLRGGMSQPWIRKCYWCQLSKSDLIDLAKEANI